MSLNIVCFLHGGLSKHVRFNMNPNTYCKCRVAPTCASYP